MLGKEENCSGEGRRPLFEKMPSFDDLSRELASGTISRRRAIKLTGGALLGTALLAFSSSPAEARRRRRNPCRGRTASCTPTNPGLGDICRGNPNCRCFRTAAGGKQCVDITGEDCPATNECNSAEDCGRNEVCVVAPGCCPETANRICIRRCPRG